MENVKKTPRFYCEHCHAEVKADARICNKCGRFFASVRCPVCGKTGTLQMFKTGCPKCGYASGVQPVQESDGKKNPQQKSAEDALPVWVYFMAGSLGVLICIICAVLYLQA